MRGFSQKLRLAAEEKADKITEVNIKELLDRIGKLWQSGDIDDVMIYEEYPDFHASIESTAD